MKIRVLLCAALALCGASAAQAAEGVPSTAKLSKLGLAAMNVVSDADGMSVRGMGSNFVKVGFNWRTAAGEKATFVNGQFVPVNPPNLSIQDTNNGSAIATDGGGITGNGIASPIVIGFQSSSQHQQDFLANNFVASEVSSARLAASIIAGNAKVLGIGSVRP